MKLRGLLVVVAAGLLSGCGSQASAPAEEPGLEPPPPIEAVDEHAPPPWDAGFEIYMAIPHECEKTPNECTKGESGCFRVSNRPGDEESWSGGCTPEEIRRIEELVRAEANAHEPAGAVGDRGRRVAEHVRPMDEIRVEDCRNQFDENDAGFQTCTPSRGEPPRAE